MAPCSELAHHRALVSTKSRAHGMLSEDVQRRVNYELGMLAPRTAQAVLIAEPSRLEIAYSRRELRRDRPGRLSNACPRTWIFICSGAIAASPLCMNDLRFASPFQLPPCWRRAQFLNTICIHYREKQPIRCISRDRNLEHRRMEDV